MTVCFDSLRMALAKMIINIFEKCKGSIHEQWEQSLKSALDQAAVAGNLKIVQAPQELQQALHEWERTADISVIAGPQHFNEERRLFIPSAPDFYKQHCLKEAPHAHYGCCLWGEYIAVEYAPASHKLSTQLHESLHLFGVDECYNPQTLEPIPECKNEQCVMRYGVNSTSVCSRVLEQLSR